MPGTPDTAIQTHTHKQLYFRRIYNLLYHIFLETISLIQQGWVVCEIGEIKHRIKTKWQVLQYLKTFPSFFLTLHNKWIWQHGLLCIYNGTYSVQCSTNLSRRICNYPVCCKLSPLARRHKPWYKLKSIFLFRLV